jgi:hypothetical protein
MTDFQPDFSDEGLDDVSDEELTIDFTGVSGADFTPVATGWYLCKVTDFGRAEVKNAGGKLAVGTPGTNWEFTIQEGPTGDETVEGRKAWTNHWHAAKSLPFMKGFLVKLDAFDEEELNTTFKLSDRQRAIGEDVCVKLAIRKYKDRDGNEQESNDVKGFKHHSEWPNLKSKGASIPSPGGSMLAG